MTTHLNEFIEWARENNIQINSVDPQYDGDNIDLKAIASTIKSLSQAPLTTPCIIEFGFFFSLYRTSTNLKLTHQSLTPIPPPRLRYPWGPP